MRPHQRFVVAAILVSAFAQPSPAAPAEQASAFERLTTLEGTWFATDPGHAGVVVRFRVIAAGSVVVEEWTTSSGRTSMTLFHRDGERLMATHYCPQGNQPRLVASDWMTGDEVALTMQDVTDLSGGESFQHDLAVQFGGCGRVSLTETYWTNEGPDVATIELVRQPGA